MSTRTSEQATSMEEEKERKIYLYLVGIKCSVQVEGLESNDHQELDEELKNALSLVYEKGYDVNQIEQLGRAVFRFAAVSENWNAGKQLTQAELAKYLKAAINLLHEVRGKNLFDRRIEPTMSNPSSTTIDTEEKGWVQGLRNLLGGL